MPAAARPAKKRGKKRAAAPKTTIQALATAKPVAEKKPAAAKAAKAAKKAKSAKRPKTKRAKSAVSKPAAEKLAPNKPASEKRVRDDFTMPKADYDRIAKLKATAKRVGLKVKKNELLRLGLQTLQRLHEDELRSAMLALRAPGANGK